MKKLLLLWVLFFLGAENKAFAQAPLFDDQTNLEIFAPAGKQSIFTVLDKTKTGLGKQALQAKLSVLQTAPDALQIQQKAIGALMADQALAGDVAMLLKQFSRAEKYIDRCMAPSLPAVKALYDDLYFKHEKLARFNGYPTLLWAAQVLPLAALVVPTLEHVLVHIGLQHVMEGKDHKHKHKHHKQGHDCLTCASKSVIPHYATHLVQIGHWGFHAAVIGGVGYEIVQKMKLCKQLQGELMQVARLVEIARELARIAQGHEAICAACRGWQRAGLYRCLCLGLWRGCRE